MWKYILKRILWLIVIMLSVAIVIFVILWFVPGDPAQIVLGSGATQADILRQREIMGLDKPFIVQLGTYLSDVFLHLDFGNSYIYGTPVINEFATRLPRTLGLGLISMALNIIIGIYLCSTVLAGTHDGRSVFCKVRLVASIRYYRLAVLDHAGTCKLTFRNRDECKTDTIRCTGNHPCGLRNNRTCKGTFGESRYLQTYASKRFDPGSKCIGYAAGDGCRWNRSYRAGILVPWYRTVSSYRRKQPRLSGYPWIGIDPCNVLSGHHTSRRFILCVP